MHLTSFLAIAMATACVALPHSNINPHPRGGFKIQMSYSSSDTAPSQNLTLTALMDPAWKYMYLVAEDPAVSSGTPAVMYSSVPIGDGGFECAIAISVNGVDYGLDVPDIGNQQGVADPVMARPGYLEYEFFIFGDSISHALSAGSNVWLACDRAFDGQMKPVLSWGAYLPNGEAPGGCRATSVYKKEYLDV